MNDSQATASSNLDAWRANLEVLIHHLTTADEPEIISEALLVLLMQGLGLFGLGPGHAGVLSLCWTC